MSSFCKNFKQTFCQFVIMEYYCVKNFEVKNLFKTF